MSAVRKHKKAQQNRSKVSKNRKHKKTNLVLNSDGTLPWPPVYDYSRNPKDIPSLAINLLAVLALVVGIFLYASHKKSNTVENYSFVSSRQDAVYITITEPVKTTKVKHVTLNLQIGDSYSTIAQRVYGDASKWRIVYDLNKDLRSFKSPHLMYFRPSITIKVLDI